MLGSLNRGGAEVLMLDVASVASQSELDCMVIHRKHGLLESEYKATGVSLNYLPVASILGVFAYLYKLRKLLILHKINIVHAHQSIDTIYAIIACMFLNIRIVQTIHGYDNGYNKFNHKLRNVTLKQSDLNIFVSETQFDYYRKKYKSAFKSKVIYNGVNFSKLISQNEYDFRKELNISPDKLLLGTVGNFSSGRDHATICRFLKLLNELKTDYVFVFVGAQVMGTPEFYNDCVEYVKMHDLQSKVHFLGARNIVPHILRSLDAFIYSSEHDTFGIAVIEAIATGIPVFVNDWSVMLEITDNGKLANLFASKDENDLLRQLYEFLDKRHTYSEKALLNKKYVIEKYSIERHIHSLKEIYQTLI